MANRRFGAAGPQRGAVNRNFNSSSSNISPWQGGAAPGNPNNNIQNQLALALTSLIQQTSQQQTPDGPPSLLNMNTSPGYYNQDQQFNNQNRFGNRGRQDFRRPEPYNKNNRGGQWRSDNVNNRINKRGTGNFSSKNRSNFRNNKPPGKDQKNDKKFNDKSAKQEKTMEDREDTEAQTNGDAKKTPKSTTYDGLPNGLLHCFVCNKSMWDGESFQNHLGGKAHKQMICSLEESFQITVNILRENMRLGEERKMIEYERMQRARRFHQKNAEPESHCNMCDLKFMGRIVVHRQTEGHQRLKRFLHPKCKRCNLEFPSRMEWVDHQFSNEHLFKLKEYLDTKNLAPGEYKLTVEDLEVEPPLEESVQNEDENPILEVSDDLENLTSRIPVYKAERAIGKESVIAAEGFMCDLCQLFMPSEEESQTHLKAFHHYHNFVEAVKLKYQKAANEKKRKAEEEATVEGEEKEEEEEAKDDEEGKEEEEDAEKANDEGEEAEEVQEEEEVEAEEEEEEVKEEKVEVKEEVKEEKKEEKPEVKVEEKKEEVVEKKTTTAATPPAAATPVPATPNTRQKRGTAVKNTPGPKSKKAKN